MYDLGFASPSADVLEGFFKESVCHLSCHFLSRANKSSFLEIEVADAVVVAYREGTAVGRKIGRDAQFHRAGCGSADRVGLNRKRSRDCMLVV